MVRRRTDGCQHDLGELDAKAVGLVDPRRIGELDRQPGDLAVAQPRAGVGLGSVVGRAVQRQAWVAAQVERLARAGIIPTQISPAASSNSTSVPLMRGEPSCRRVASVACLRMANVRRTCWANSGSAASTVFHEAIRPLWR